MEDTKLENELLTKKFIHERNKKILELINKIEDKFYKIIEKIPVKN